MNPDQNSPDLDSPDARDRLAAETVLGLADGADAALADRLMAEDAGFRALVETWRLRFAELDATAAPQPAGADLWARIEGTLPDQAPAAVAPAVAPAVVAPATPRSGASPARPPRPRPGLRARLAGLWDNLDLWRGIGLAAGAAVLVLAIGVTALVRQTQRTPVLVAVLLSDTNRPAAVVNAFANGRTELVPLAAVDVPKGKALQVWTLWDRARGPVSVGLLQAMHNLELAVRDLPAATADQLFEITLEPEGGSPTGRPTGPILMKGNASRAL